MWKPQVALAAALIALSGCAAIQGQSASDSVQILAQAGFRREPAPERSAQGATGRSGQGLKLRQLTAATENGEPRYEFYDPDFCRCVYVGGANEHARLQQLRAARINERNQALRAWNPSANSPDPAVWGAWNPQGLDLK